MLDGPQWADRGTAYQRELLPQKVLTKLGWLQVLRVWLPTWLHEREETRAHLRASIETAIAHGATTGATEAHAAEGTFKLATPGTDVAVQEPAEVGARGMAESAPSITDGMDRRDPSAPSDDAAIAAPQDLTTPAAASYESRSRSSGAGKVLDDFVPFEPVLIDSNLDLRALGDPQVDAVIHLVIAEVLKAEAPIESTRLIRFVGQCLGFERVRAKTSQRILMLVEPALLEVTPVGTTIWRSTEQRVDWQGYRPSSVAQRPVDEIPFIEYTEALHHLGAQRFASPEDRMRALANAFGIRRLGHMVQSHLDLVITHADSGAQSTAQASIPSTD
jgi:hypothetical protein